MKEIVGQKKTREKEFKVKPNPKFDQSNEETDYTLEEDFPLGTIHMIGGPNHPNLDNRIRGRSALSYK